jgi:hypothetical protein
VQSYLAGVDFALQFDRPGIVELTEATVKDEEFALAHAMLGRQLQIHGFRADVRQHLERAASLKAATTQREQSTIDVILASASFDADAIGLAQNHVSIYPQDVLVLAQLTGPFGLLAFSGQKNWAAQNVALLQSTESAYPADDWWHMTARGFMAAETGELGYARVEGERAWALSECGSCAHTLTHVHFEARAIEEGSAFISQWKGVYGDSSDMRHHLMWHLALLGRAAGAGADALMQMYESELDADICDPMPLTTFSDNAALLWRCHLAGMEVPGSLGRDLLRYADTHFTQLGFAFADIHRVMSTALLGDREVRQQLADELASLSREKETEQARCMLQFAKGINAFADADFAAAVALLRPVLPDAVLLGGSNPQRRVIEETYLEAQRRAQQ